MTARTLAAAFLAVVISPALADAPIRVVDGDTLRVGAERIRIIGVDTPEFRQGRCPSERALALAAKDTAEQLVAGGGVVIERTGETDRYDRSLARVSVRGVDWLLAMQNAGAAARSYHRGKRKGWC